MDTRCMLCNGITPDTRTCDDGSVVCPRCYGDALEYGHHHVDHTEPVADCPL